MFFSIIAHILIDGVNLTIGVYVLLKNPRSAIHRSFFLFVLGVVGWSAGMKLLLWTEQPSLVTATLWSAELILIGLVWFSEVFPENHPVGKKFFVLLLPLFIIFLLTPSSLFIRSVQFNGHDYLEPENGPLFLLFGATLGAYILLSIVKLFRKYRRLHGIHRVQMRYFAAGAGIFLFAGFITNVWLPAVHVFHFNLFGPLFSAVFIGCAAYAIVRHEFMDIRIVIQRGLLYLFSIAIISLLFFSTDFLIRQFTQQEGFPDDVIAAVLGAFGFVWFRRFFEKTTDRFFFRGDYDYAAAVQDLGPLLHSTIDLETLLRTLDGFLMRTIKPERTIFFRGSGGSDGPGGQDGLVGSDSLGGSDSLVGSDGLVGSRLFRIFFHDAAAPSHAAFRDAASYERAVADFLAETPRPLFIQELDKGVQDDVDPAEAARRRTLCAAAHTLNVAAVIPLSSRDEFPAMMLLGKKLSDDIFRSKDIELLFVIAHQAGMAIENARLYETVRRHSEELENRVKERTEKIQSMHETQSKFLTDVSHELQTPVAILKGNMEILERKKRGERKTALQVMGTTLDRMSRMVDHLLAVARLNFSKDELHKQEIQAENMLEEIYNDCLILAEDKGVLLSYTSERAIVAGDRDKLKEVILNLVSNALKHTPSGGKIAIMGRVVGANAEVAEIAVADTGLGIAPEELPYVFKRFYRIHEERVAGTGLGLDICRKIIEDHCGTIRAESELGKGSQFIVSLPIAAKL